MTSLFKHYTIIAEGWVDELSEGFKCRKGSAYMGMKVWADSYEQAADVYQSVGKHIGFNVTGNLEFYNSEPLEPPGENPSAYGINFTPFED